MSDLDIDHKDQSYMFVEESKPPQYAVGIDTFSRMKTNATFNEAVGMCKANIDKYTWRTKGQDRKDVEKIIAYAQEWLWWLDNEQ